MKHESIACFTKALLVLVGISVCSTALSQPRVPYHPGDTITIAISFEGADASRVRTGIAYFGVSGTRSHQAGFQAELGFDNAKPAGPNTIEVSFKVGSHVASGTYKLTQVRAGTEGDSPVSIIYNDGLPAFNLTIENPERFEKPTIKSVKDVSKP